MRCICIDISSRISNLFKKENIFSSTRLNFSCILKVNIQVIFICLFFFEKYIFTFKIHEKFNFFEENIFSCLGS